MSLYLSILSWKWLFFIWFVKSAVISYMLFYHIKAYYEARYEHRWNFYTHWGVIAIHCVYDLMMFMWNILPNNFLLSLLTSNNNILYHIIYFCDEPSQPDRPSRYTFTSLVLRQVKWKELQNSTVVINSSSRYIWVI